MASTVISKNKKKFKASQSGRTAAPSRASVESEQEYITNQQIPQIPQPSVTSQQLPQPSMTATPLIGTLGFHWNTPLPDRARSPGSSSEEEESGLQPAPPLSSALVTATQSSATAVNEGDDDEDEDEDQLDDDNDVPPSYRVNLRDAGSGFVTRKSPMTEEQRLAAAINDSFKPVEFTTNFKSIGKNSSEALRGKVLDWIVDGKRRDPRTITNLERKEMQKLRIAKEKKSQQFQTRADKSSDRAKRHLMNTDARSAGKAHKFKQKKRMSGSVMKKLLSNNDRVALINSTPPIFTVWERSDSPRCSAKECITQHRETKAGRIKAYSKTLVMIRCVAGVRMRGGRTPVSRLYYHAQCLPDKQFIGVLTLEDDTLVIGNWSTNASETMNKLYTEAVHRSIQHVTPPPDEDVIKLNISLRAQKRLNRADPDRKKTWDTEMAKWMQEMESKWKSRNAREVSSLQNKNKVLVGRIVKVIAESHAAVAKEKEKTAFAERYQEKAMSLVHNENRRHSSKHYLKRFNANQIVAQRNAQRQDNLQKLQVAGIVKNAIAEDEDIRVKLFASILRQIPDNSKAIEIFQHQLDDITSRDPDGFSLDSFSEQFLNFLDMGDYALPGIDEPMDEDEVDELNQELIDIVADAQDRNIPKELSEIAKRTLRRN